MRALCASVFIFVFLVAASAADLKVKVVDPQSAAVAGAQVSLFAKGTDIAFKLANTSAEGIASFSALNPGQLESSAFRIQVLAPGFAPQTEDVPAHSDVITIRLHLAAASETVVVTATSNPVPAEESGADVSTLENGQLKTMQPVAANDAVRFLPGAVVNTAGQRGGLSSLFVRGGESNYNKVIVDGVTINEPGGTFDFGTLPLTEANRMEFLRGTQSTLYGSDAMTSVVQVFTRTGSTRTPELLLAADGGNFSTANGNAAISGARGRFDYNFFGDQFNTNGSGINNAYSDSLQGANVGVAVNQKTSLRLHIRHSNSHTGVPGEWSFNGYDPLVDVNGVIQPLPPDPNESSQLNSLLGSVELTVAEPSGWQHHFS
ncbi:MAG: TonB-dependent receptor plug domain-containing protein, partial [Candidatus Sulfotelmatobacter sp.]